MNIIIDPRFRYNYATFYYLGLCRFFGKSNICFDLEPFQELPYNTMEHYGRGFAFVICADNIKRKVFIDVNDKCDIMFDRYEWAHVYCKINVKYGDSLIYDKLLVIGPSFGIKVSNMASTFLLCCKNMEKIRKCDTISLYYYLRDYLYPFFRRVNYDLYERKLLVDDNYVFHASTLWYDRVTDSTTNKYRGDFLQCCKSLGIQIGGGLLFIDDPKVLKEFPVYANYLEKYKDFLYNKRIGMKEYINETKRSFVVFNTPSVAGCHGWKLAEYLCMGKAIISTPLSREMPGKGLVNGENIHIVRSTEDIYSAVSQIRNDKIYRLKLEKAARAYYNNYLAPEMVVKRILQRCDLAQ